MGKKREFNSTLKVLPVEYDKLINSEEAPEIILQGYVTAAYERVSEDNELVFHRLQQSF